jgi:hypothetical protein
MTKKFQNESLTPPPSSHSVPSHCSVILSFFNKCLPLSKQIQTKMVMVETISLDSRTIMVKARKETDLSDVIKHIAQTKRNQVNSFLEFASAHRVLEAGYKFNREDCYDR